MNYELWITFELTCRYGEQRTIGQVKRFVRPLLLNPQQLRNKLSTSIKGSARASMTCPLCSRLNKNTHRTGKMVKTTFDDTASCFLIILLDLLMNGMVIEIKGRNTHKNRPFLLLRLKQTCANNRLLEFCQQVTIFKCSSFYIERINHGDGHRLFNSDSAIYQPLERDNLKFP